MSKKKLRPGAIVRADSIDKMIELNERLDDIVYNQDPEKGGIKHDDGKPRPELIPPEFILGVAEVLKHGAKKYDDWNWSKGMSWLRVYGALQRHMLAWLSCNDYDDETGMLHLEHAACCLMFLHYYQHNEKGTDDRHRR